jgi:hypothetical protein
MGDRRRDVYSGNELGLQVNDAAGVSLDTAVCVACFSVCGLYGLRLSESHDLANFN